MDVMCAACLRLCNHMDAPARRKQASSQRGAKGDSWTMTAAAPRLAPDGGESIRAKEDGWAGVSATACALFDAL